MTKKNIALFAIVLLSFYHTSIAQLPPQAVILEEFKNYKFDHNGIAIPYRLLTPEPTGEDQKLPLIVALHGAENFGATPDRFLTWAGSYALGWLKPWIQNKYPCFVAAPHLYHPLYMEEGYSGWGEKKIIGFSQAAH